jgi:Holliday junction resolvase RusA-like endonuclease
MLEFTVVGTPIPQGSTKSFYNKKTEKVHTTHTNDGPLQQYRYNVSQGCLQAMTKNGIQISDAPVIVDVLFVFKRPKARKHQHFKTTRPDLDKHIRAVLDALSGIAYNDDAQVVCINAMKVYSDTDYEQTVISLSLKSEGEKG